MRILVATDHWSPDHRGGAARVAAETAMLLARRGHDVDVIAPATRGWPREWRDGSLVVRRVLPRTALPQTLTDPLQTYLAAAERDADLALAHTSTTAVGLSLALRTTPLALVFHASAAREAAFERSRLPRGRRRAATATLEPVLRLLERASLRRAARVLVLSEFSRRLLEADHPDALGRTWLVPGGVDTTAFTPGDRSAARTALGVSASTQLLLTVRRLEPRMGLERLLEAVALLASGRPDLAVAIVGDGSLRGPLEERRRRLGLERRVHFAGRVSDTALVDWYRAADLFVLPTIAYEGFGLVTAEALATGTPVVGTPVGATPELLRPLDERLLSAGTGSNELAAAIARGLGLATPEFGRRCRVYAEERLSWTAAFPAWEAALGTVPDLRTEQPAESPGADLPVSALRSRS